MQILHFDWLRYLRTISNNHRVEKLAGFSFVCSQNINISSTCNCYLYYCLFCPTILDDTLTCPGVISPTSITLQRIYWNGNYGVLWQELTSLTLPCFRRRFLWASRFPFFALIEASCKLFRYIAAAPKVKMLHHWYSVIGDSLIVVITIIIFMIRYQMVSLLCSWFKCVMWLNIPQLALGNIRVMLLNFQNWTYCKKY